MIDKNRMVEEFLQLTSIDSVTRKERRMADTLTQKLKELGYEVIEDSTGERSAATPEACSVR